MYKYELHLHTEETSFCGHVPAEEQVRMYKELGYDGICVTDHFHHVYLQEWKLWDNWDAFVDRYMAGYRAAKEAGDRIGLHVIFGVELRFPEDDRDYLTFGIDEAWLRAHPFCCQLSHQEFFDTYKDELLFLQAHPFRYYEEGDAAHVHGIEIINGNPRHNSRNDRALAFAELNGSLIRVAGSDAHQYGDEGKAAILFEKEITDTFELREEIEAGRFRLWSPDFEQIIKRSEDNQKMFDSMIIGQVCLDTNTDYDGTVEHRPGGAVLFSGNAAGAIGHNTAVVPKGNPKHIDMQAVFAENPNVTVFERFSETTTLMENTYFTPDRERRRQLSPESIEPYTAADLPDADARIYHLAGLVTGDISGDMIRACYERTEKLREAGADDRVGVALDVQCMLRAVEPDKTLKLYDWAEKKEYLPYIRYFKTDAAEAEMLTGLTDREAAARLMCSWGAKEVMITHNTEVIVCDGENIYRAPLKPRNLSGRTGRGDTTFAGYINERLDHDIQTALNFAASLVSLKMETPGPFTGTREDVYRYMDEVMGLKAE